LKQSMLWTDPKEFFIHEICRFCLANSFFSLPWNLNETGFLTQLLDSHCQTRLCMFGCRGTYASCGLLIDR
jgi:hypothetical protein